MNYLGDCYYEGTGVKQDFCKAANLYLKALESDCNLKGKGVDKETTRASMYQMALQACRDPHALHDLALCYDRGLGVEQDFHKAAVVSILTGSDGCVRTEAR
ncbi:hypothetical protein Pelo_19902 [Pelomyxa schiedti]|nr:hypothetical protein Pelo_19902 [Pelomyxa schiedti]